MSHPTSKIRVRSVRETNVAFLRRSETLRVGQFGLPDSESHAVRIAPLGESGYESDSHLSNDPKFEFHIFGNTHLLRASSAATEICETRTKVWPALVARVREETGPRRHALFRESKPVAVRTVDNIGI